MTRRIVSKITSAGSLMSLGGGKSTASLKAGNSSTSTSSPGESFTDVVANEPGTHVPTPVRRPSLAGGMWLA
jgi:hypothetical protein